SRIENLNCEIARCGLPRRRMPLSAPLELKLSEARGLIDGLAGNSCALLVRQLLRALGFDETLHLQWRIEHKLIQPLVLRAWIPEVIPVSCGLGAFAHALGTARLRECFPKGYRIKHALGDSSGEEPQDHAGEAILREFGGGTFEDRGLLGERYVVQEQIA